MFTFEDLATLDAAGGPGLLRNVEKDKLPIALKGASETLRDLFFSNMSERAGKMLREEIASLGPGPAPRRRGGAGLYRGARQGSRRAQGVIEIGSGEDEELVY